MTKRTPRPRPRRVMYLYPWDLLDEGVDAITVRLRRAKIDGVQVALAYHIGTYLLPHNMYRVLYYGPHGAVFFSPRVERYPEQLRPLVADGFADQLRDALMRLAAEGFHLTAWIVYNYSHALARASPHAARRTCFGDLDGVQLCPAQPDVHAYAAALSEDALELAPFDAVLIESLHYLPFGYGVLNPKIGISLTKRAQLLLGLCFCPACLTAAEERGAPLVLRERVANWLRTHLNNHPDTTEPDDAHAWLREAFGGALTPLLDARRDIATELQTRTLQSFRKHGLAVGSNALHNRDTIITGIDPARVAPLLDYHWFVLPTSGAREAVHSECAWAEQTLAPNLPIYGLIRPGDVTDREAFLNLHKAAAGLQGTHYYTYGTMSLRQLTWLEESSLKEGPTA